MAHAAALIVAGGSAERFGAERPKQFLELAGKTLLQHALELFERVPQIDATYLVLPVDYLETFQSFVDLARAPKFRRAVAGGARRQDSVQNGLAAIDAGAELVAVHDAARPLADPRAIERALERAAECGGAILAAPTVDTLKQCGADGRIAATLKRERIWRAQTPQVFRLELLREAYRHIAAQKLEITDEAQALEHLGHPVEIVRSSNANLKITTPADLAFAEWRLAQPRPAPE